jgi:hypothetical protein
VFYPFYKCPVSPVATVAFEWCKKCRDFSSSNLNHDKSMENNQRYKTGLK